MSPTFPLSSDSNNLENSDVRVSLNVNGDKSTSYDACSSFENQKQRQCVYQVDKRGAKLTFGKEKPATDVMHYGRKRDGTGRSTLKTHSNTIKDSRLPCKGNCDDCGRPTEKTTL